MATPKRILFVAESVTLAHVARPAALAQSLDQSRYSPVLACDERYQDLLANADIPLRTLPSVTPQHFLDALARGSPVYDRATLRGYVKADLALIADTGPDLVVGDFRLSLSISARLAGIPYISISNAYWSPYARQHFPVPVLPLAKVFGSRLTSVLFRLARPLAFAYHCRPLNQVRRAHGLPTLGSDLRRVYTDADHTVYADVPELFPTFELPRNHHYLGPVLWSPPTPHPAWWEQLPTDRPLVYLTLGSSGPASVLPAVLEALAPLPVTVLAATAGQPCPDRLPDNVRVATYLPGVEAARRATLVVCNGGSPTSQQALAAGVPVLGVPANMDQMLNMQAIETFGAGKLVRADQASAATLHHHASRMLADGHMRKQAQRLGAIFARYPAADRFAALLEQVLQEKKGR